MTDQHELDRMLSVWLDDPSTPPAPTYLGAVLDRTRHTRQRPAWASLERWLPMELTWRTAAVPRWGWLLVSLALLIAMLALAAAVGSRFAVTGGSINGLIAFDWPDGDIYVADPNGANVRPFVTGPAKQFGPVWSPDGTMLAYFEETEESTATVPKATVHIVGADGTGDKVLGGGEGVTSTLVGSSPYVFTIYGLAWSPDSRTVGYTELESTDLFKPHIEMVDIDGSDAKRLDVDLEAWDPAWSPDGQWIAFKGRQDPDNRSQGVWVAHPDGTELRRVTTTPHADAEDRGFAFSAPRWSPDGRTLLYYCCEGGLHDIWLAEVDGSNERRITTDVADEYWPSWSPDGTRIAFQFDPPDDGSNNCCSETWLATPDGADPVKVDGPLVGTTGSIVWSPDGSAIVSLAETWVDFVIVDIPSGEVRATIADPVGGTEPGNYQVSWQRRP
jgi:Tol biopolymer transport system component